ncbi:glycoside hydrolase domain-containing protein [Streptomyces sp. L7]
MESYDTTNTSCNSAVLTYVRAFDKELHAKIYRSGIYGFTGSSAKAIATATDKTDLPGNLWYAVGQGQHDDLGLAVGLPPVTGHSRARQYLVSSEETRGGYHDHRGPRRVGRAGGHHRLSRSTESLLTAGC